GKQRSRFAPDLPTVAESGLPGYAFDSWLGLLAPAGIAPAERDKLNAAVNSVLADPKVQARLAALGVEAEARSPAQFQELLKADWDAAGKLVAASGARVVHGDVLHLRPGGAQERRHAQVRGAAVAGGGAIVGARFCLYR
ncbi:tripartite tricarboxylate transporter substrate-binding protein, partial [Achromobacter xylosoxidans]